VRETLYIRLRAVDPAAPTAYCIARADAVASFPIEHAPLERVLAMAAGRRLVVLVPSADVRLCSVAVPAKQIAKVQQAVPFALEDQLADDVETLHFAVGTRDANGNWSVAVVSRERIEQWLALFAAHGVRPDAMLPDVLALPIPGDDQFCMLVDGDSIAVRTGPASGFVCGREDLELCLDIADPERKCQLRTLIARNQTFDPTRLSWSVDPLHGFADPFEALLQNLDPSAGIELLQGEYSAKQDWLRLWQPWRAVAALLLSVLLLTAMTNGVQAWRLGTELAALNERNQTRYREVFPDETRIVDLEAQLNQQLARLEGGATSAELLGLMNLMAESVGAVPGLRLQAVQYRDASLYASLSAEGLQALEQLKGWFEQPRSARLEVQSANSGNEGVQIRIKLVPA
jgi:general secretion pathway protein L